ncbi:hypothetical protein FSP39_005387 [Pinctada imbricata]|uniref:Uncharacterized protein n=1 Tax=Pinctada imbricata TaxID=66713 RepID=A0AA89BSH1_PINIB|nr:hypothetical protein FSP39_005387 [Pinctada imbricata]
MDSNLISEEAQLMETLDLILTSNADVNIATTPDGDSPLIIAVEKRSINEVRRLLEVENIDLEYKTPEPWCHTALSYSIIFQSQEKCKLLLEKGADVNVRGRDGFTPLIQAIGLGAEFLQLLIDFGADVNAKSDTDVTPLSNAIQSEFLDETICLLANGADPNLSPSHMNQIPLLAYTCIYSNYNVSLELMKYGADVNIMYKNCKLLHLARHPEVTKALLEAGLHPDCLTAADNNTPLSIACFHSLFEVAKVLLEANANANHVDDDGDTPLHYATYKNNGDITQLLLDYGANPHAVNIYNASPVWNAVYRGNIGIVRNFLLRNVDLNVVSRGTKHMKGAGFLFSNPMSLLHVAVQNNYGDVAELLSQCLCDMNREQWLDGFVPEVSQLDQEHISLYRKMKTAKDSRSMPSLLRLCSCKDKLLLEG